MDPKILDLPDGDPNLAKSFSVLSIEEEEQSKSQNRYKFYIFGFVMSVLFFWVIVMRLFSDQKINMGNGNTVNIGLLYPITNIPARILFIFWHPFQIMSMFGSVIALHLSAIPGQLPFAIFKKGFFMTVGVVEFWNVIRMAIAECATESLYYIFEAICLLIVVMLPFYFHQRFVIVLCLCV